MKKRIISLALVAVVAMAALTVTLAIADDMTKVESLTKTAVWTDDDLENMQIDISSANLCKKYDGTVLFLGSLCANHSLDQKTVIASINAVAKYSAVEYHLWQHKSPADTATAVTGTVSKNGTLTKQQQNAISLGSSTHSTVYDFAQVLADAAKSEKQYDYIVMEFDGMRMGSFDTEIKAGSDNAKNLNAAAEYLLPYYANDQVCWIIPDVTKNQTNDNYASGLTGYGTYMYNDIYFDAVDNKTDWVKKRVPNVRSTIKLLAPEDLVEGEVSGKLADQKTFIARANPKGDAKDRIWVFYEDASSVSAFLENRLTGEIYSDITIEDTINEGFLLDESNAVIGQYYNETSKAWTNCSTEIFSYKINGQKVTGHFKVDSIGHTQVKMLLNCHIDPDNDPYSETVTEWDTNDGDATAVYSYNDEDKLYAEVESPSLEKVYYPITTSVTGGTITESDTVLAGHDKTVTYSPNDYYELVSVTVDGTALSGKDLNDHKSSYTFEDVSDAHTIAVVYELPEYDIVFDSQGGTDVDPQTVNAGEKATEPTDPTRTGYTFVNWTTDVDGNNEYDFDSVVTDDVKLYGQWDEDKVVISYEASEGGSVNPAKETVAADTGTATGSTATPDTGYRFKNWTDSEGNEVGTDPNFVPEKNSETGVYEEETYTANFELDEYTVDFDVQGHGTAPKDQTVTHGSKASEPDPAPAEDGYQFKGWYNEAGCTNKYDFDTPVTGDKTLYALWDTTVTFKDIDGPGGKDESVNVHVGNTVEEPKDVSTTGYEFDGWFTDPECKVPFNFDTEIEEPTTLYPLWTEVTVPLHYDANGGQNAPGDQTQYYTKQTIVANGEPNRTGYTFKGWATSKERANAGTVDFEKKDVYKNADVVPVEATLYAVWEENDVTINYVAHAGGTVSSASETLKADTGKAAGSVATPSEGYEFVNWTDMLDAVVGTDATFVPGKSVTAGIYVPGTYYANFQLKKYKVDFDTQGHGTAPADQIVTHGSKAIDPRSPEADGYTFAGWFTDPECTKPFDFDTPITKDITLYGEWETPVNFIDPTGPNTKTNTVNVIVDEKVDKPEKPECTGYTFDGWFADPDYKVPFDFDKTINSPTDVYGKWTEITVPLHYDANGGQNAPEDQTQYFSQVTTVSENEPIRPGYTFMGWATTKDKADKGTVEFDPASTYKEAKIVPVEATLYAVWQENDAEIQYIAKTGGTVSSDGETIKDDTGTATGSTASQNTGYTFKNWTDKDGKEVSDEETFVPQKNPDTGLYESAVYYANFTLNQYTFSFDAQGHGEDPSDQKVFHGAKATEPEDPEEEGYIFCGWYNDTDCKDPYDFETKVTGDKTVYGKWETPVSFIEPTGPDTETKVVNVEVDHPVNEPENPKCTGYSFGGWFTDDTYKETFDFSQKITEPTDIYGKWTEVTTPLHYNANGGQGAPEDQTQYYTAATVVSKQIPTRPGYTFMGWADSMDEANDGKVEYDPESVFKAENIVPEESTLYAVWQEDDVTIRYVAREGGTVTNDSETIKRDTGDPAGSVARNNKGYTFAKWTDEDGNTLSEDPTFVPSRNPDTVLYDEATYYAEFTINSYTVSFDPQGHGEKPKDQVVTFMQKATEPDPLTEEEYRFDGWFNEPSCETPHNFDDPVTDDITLYGKWTKIHTVTFDLHGHGTPQPDAQKVANGDKATNPSVFDEEGYRFKGWFTDGTYSEPFDFAQPIYEDKVVHAKWETIVDFIDPTGPGTPGERESVDVGDKTGHTTPSKEGYDFYGWFCDPEYTIPFNFDEPVTEPTVVYAQWVEKTAVLHFDVNGGDDIDESDQEMRYTEAENIFDVIPTRDGFAFIGWAVSKEDADAGRVSYKVGDEIKAANVVPEDLTLFAVWEKINVPNPKTVDHQDILQLVWIFIGAFALFVFCLLLGKRKKHA